MNKKSTGKSSSLIRSSALMAVATSVSRLFGLIREQLIAAYFGAGGLTDAFFVANRIPNMLRDLFAEGAFSSAFVPVFTEVKEQQGSEHLKDLFSRVFYILGIITFGLSTLMVFLAPYLVELFAPKFSQNPEIYILTVRMLRILSPFLTIISLAALCMGVLNTHKYFFWPAISPALLNVVVILSILGLPQILEKFGLQAVESLAVGILLGGLAQLFFQWIKVRKLGFSLRSPFGYQDGLISPEVRAIMKKMGPGLFGFAITQINLLVNTILATGSLSGAVSWLNFAFRLFQLPVGVLSVSLGSANLIHFAQKWKGGDQAGAFGELSKSCRASWTVLVPVAAFTILFAWPIVLLIFGRGEFDLEDAQMTTLALQCYGVGLPLYGLHKILVPVFYTVDRADVPVRSALVGIVLNIAIGVWGIDRIGFHVLAIGTGISMLGNNLVLIYYARKVIDLKFWFFFNRDFLLTLLASGLGALAIGYGLFQTDLWTQLTYGASLISLVILIVAGFVLFFGIYAGSLGLLGGPNFLQLIKRRFR